MKVFCGLINIAGCNLHRLCVHIRYTLPCFQLYASDLNKSNKYASGTCSQHGCDSMSAVCREWHRNTNGWWEKLALLQALRVSYNHRERAESELTLAISTGERARNTHLAFLNTLAVMTYCRNLSRRCSFSSSWTCEVNNQLQVLIKSPRDVGEPV